VDSSTILTEPLTVVRPLSITSAPPPIPVATPARSSIEPAYIAFECELWVVPSVGFVSCSRWAAVPPKISATAPPIMRAPALPRRT
jgi:hypothetical protein